MKGVLVELLPELFELVFFGASSLGLVIVGGYVERFALTTVEAGQVKLGAWFAIMGAVAFYFAYLLSTDKVGPRLSEVRRRVHDRRA